MSLLQLSNVSSTFSRKGKKENTIENSSSNKHPTVAKKPASPDSFRHQIINNVSFTLQQGELACLLGPSGCGKTTILRAIAGFQAINAGEISINDKLVSSIRQNTPPEDRHVGMVFQDFALFPHLNVHDNICFGLTNNSKQNSREVVADLLALTGLSGMEKRFPHELSGGQQQRVALARALAPAPSLLLLDEPFSSLDTELRQQLNLQVRDILKHYGIGAILVTHDQNEAFAFADHIGLLRDGELQQWDSPFNLYHEPNNAFVANFIGHGEFLPGFALSPTAVNTELGEIRGNRAYDWPIDAPVEVLVRPEDITYQANSQTRAKVIHRVFAGSNIRYTLELPTGSRLESLFSSHVDYAVGKEIGITLDMEHLIAFEKNA